MNGDPVTLMPVTHTRRAWLDREALRIAAGVQRATFKAVAWEGAEQPHMSLIGDAGAPLFVHLLRDQLRATVERLVAELPKEGGLDDLQREQRFAEIAERRLEVERKEEAVICAAEAEGYRIARRREADPRAVLEVVEN